MKLSKQFVTNEIRATLLHLSRSMTIIEGIDFAGLQASRIGSRAEALGISTATLRPAFFRAAPI